MKRKKVPFYSERMKDETAYTLYIDSETKDVYRVINRSGNLSLNYIVIILYLAYLRFIMSVSLSYELPFILVSVFVSSIVVSYVVGVFVLKGTMNDLRP